MLQVDGFPPVPPPAAPASSFPQGKISLYCCFSLLRSLSLTLTLFLSFTLLVYQICIAFELRLAQGFVAGACRLAYTALATNGVLILCEFSESKDSRLQINKLTVKTTGGSAYPKGKGTRCAKDKLFMQSDEYAMVQIGVILH